MRDYKKSLGLGLSLALMAGCSVFSGGSPLLVENQPVPGGPSNEPYFTVQHGSWNAFLKTYRTVDANGIARIRYAAVTPQDRRTLETYLEGLSKIRASDLGAAERLAYWINFYNANMVALVLERFPPGTRIEVSQTMRSPALWNDRVVRLDGRKVKLREVRREMVEGQWQDVPLRFLLSCPLVSCPNIGASAYTGQSLRASAFAAARDFVNHPRAVSVKRHGIALSFWFDSGFGANTTQLLAGLEPFARQPLLGQLRDKSRSVNFRADWRINVDNTPVPQAVRQAAFAAKAPTVTRSAPPTPPPAAIRPPQPSQPAQPRPQQQPQRRVTPPVAGASAPPPVRRAPPSQQQLRAMQATRPAPAVTAPPRQQAPPPAPQNPPQVRRPIVQDDIGRRLSSTQPVPARTQAPARRAAPPPRGGGLWIQLGAMGSEERARVLWNQRVSQYPNELQNLRVYYERRETSSGGVIYRVKAGPVSRQDAGRICQVVVDCFVTGSGP